MLDALMVHSRLKHMIYWWSVPHGPLGFVEKPGLTALTLICHQSKEDKFGQSTNGLLDPWGRCHKIYTATDITDFVSNVSICIPLFPPWCWYPHFNSCVIYYGELHAFPIIMTVQSMPWRLRITLTCMWASWSWGSALITAEDQA